MPETSHFIEIDGKEIPLFVVRNARARRVSLRIMEHEGKVKLTMPKRYSMEKALAFAHERKIWIANHQHLLTHRALLRHGETIPIFGQPQLIVHRAGMRTSTYEENGQLIVGGMEAHVSGRIKRYLKQRMKTYCTQKTREFARMLTIEHRLHTITIRETSSRWGSCSSSGNISLCWRLIFAPKEVLDYVILHEVAHLIEMNHSAAFWQIVATIDPDYVRHKKWLRLNGHRLWAYQLESSSL